MQQPQIIQEEMMMTKIVRNDNVLVRAFGDSNLSFNGWYSEIDLTALYLTIVSFNLEMSRLSLFDNLTNIAKSDSI